jgi:hypothetical protein
MSLRRFLARAQAVLQSLSRAERHRRKVQRTLALPLKELSPVEAADWYHLAEGIEMIRTGEFPVVVEAEDRPGIYVYDEPIGPKLPTVDEQFAWFHAAPLDAPLPGAPAKDNPDFAVLLRSAAPSPPVVEALEKTGSWDRGFLAKLARGER